MRGRVSGLGLLLGLGVGVMAGEEIARHNRYRDGIRFGSMTGGAAAGAILGDSWGRWMAPDCRAMEWTPEATRLMETYVARDRQWRRCENDRVHRALPWMAGGSLLGGVAGLLAGIGIVAVTNLWDREKYADGVLSGMTGLGLTTGAFWAYGRVKLRLPDCGPDALEAAWEVRRVPNSADPVSVKP